MYHVSSKGSAPDVPETGRETERDWYNEVCVNRLDLIFLMPVDSTCRTL